MKCTICKAETSTAFTIDIDLPKFPFCESHRKEVSTLLLFAQIMNPEEFEKVSRKMINRQKKVITEN